VEKPQIKVRGIKNQTQVLRRSVDVRHGHVMKVDAASLPQGSRHGWSSLLSTH